MIPKFLRPEVVPYASVEIVRAEKNLPRVDRQSSRPATGTTANSATERLSMSVTKNVAHTPGPWGVRLHSGTSVNGAAIESLVETVTVAVLPRRADRPYPQKEADASLIAAAPDLLAALKETSFRLAALVAASGDFSDINAKALDAASIVIAKAEGQ
jgi:phosphoglycolate phosphatase-like HAD superfamily hydrolase